MPEVPQIKKYDWGAKVIVPETFYAEAYGHKKGRLKEVRRELLKQHNINMKDYTATEKGLHRFEDHHCFNEQGYFWVNVMELKKMEDRPVPEVNE